MQNCALKYVLKNLLTRANIFSSNFTSKKRKIGSYKISVVPMVWPLYITFNLSLT